MENTQDLIEAAKEGEVLNRIAREYTNLCVLSVPEDSPNPMHHLSGQMIGTIDTLLAEITRMDNEARATADPRIAGLCTAMHVHNWYPTYIDREYDRKTAVVRHSNLKKYIINACVDVPGGEAVLRRFWEARTEEAFPA